MRPTRTLDVLVIGAGQAGLAAGYFLCKSSKKPSFLVIDADAQPGGSWRHAWRSLRLFSPAQVSSLPGWLMPSSLNDPARYPTREDVIAYLTQYERRYNIPVERPVRAISLHSTCATVDDTNKCLKVITDSGAIIEASAVISATGTWQSPIFPSNMEGLPPLPCAHNLTKGKCTSSHDVTQSQYKSDDYFQGRILHSAHYKGPQDFSPKERVLVVGGGNSGVQIYVDLLNRTPNVTWVTRDPPQFLPDHVDGHYLFTQGTKRFLAMKEGKPFKEEYSIGSIVMVDPVKRAREMGDLHSKRMFARLTKTGVVWADGKEESVDTVIFATGFRPNLAHLAPLALPNKDGKLEMDGLHTSIHPRLYPLGYGDWTGSFASATIIGAGRAAKSVVGEIESVLL